MEDLLHWFGEAKREGVAFRRALFSISQAGWVSKRCEAGRGAVRGQKKSATGSRA
jgi:hypothetical protein